MKSPLILRRVEGHSMAPTLAPDDLVLASPLLKIRTGSIAIARVEGRECIKRVKSVNGSQVWLIGDNYYHSHDSRRFGWINKENLLGTVLVYSSKLNVLKTPLTDINRLS